jgi:TM2 domain-containing membrane protein YozV
MDGEKLLMWASIVTLIALLGGVMVSWKGLQEYNDPVLNGEVQQNPFK